MVSFVRFEVCPKSHFKGERGVDEDVAPLRFGLVNSDHCFRLVFMSEGLDDGLMQWEIICTQKISTSE